MSLETNLRAMERTREAYWRRYPATSPVKLRWRALTVRHCFHTLPGESILELGAGSGLWTEHLATALKGECPITAVVFDERQFIGPIAIHLVGGGEDERRVGTKPPRRFEHGQRALRVDREVGVRVPGGPVV